MLGAGSWNLLVISGCRQPQTLRPGPSLLCGLCLNARNPSGCFPCIDRLTASTVTPLPWGHLPAQDEVPASKILLHEEFRVMD